MKKNGYAGLALVLSGWMAAVPARAASPETSGNVFMWRLGDGDDPSYLVGSIHVGTDAIYPLPPSFDAAFDACSTLVVEADPEGGDPLTMKKLVVRHALDLDGPTLAEKIGPELTGKLATVLERNRLEMKVLAKAKPWFAAQMISLVEMARLGVDFTRGIDLYFLNKARGKKTIRELEGAEYQLRYLDGLSAEEQRLMLEYSLRDLENMEALLAEMMGAWTAGDAERLELLMTGYIRESKGLEDAFDRLLVQRNGPMFETIRDLLDTGERCFIVVGAGHLVGDEGLVARLREDGIAVTQCGRESRISRNTAASVQE